MKSVRQKASRIQCVVEYVRASRAFTPRVRRMANFVRRTHHTVNLTVLLNIKQHCLDEIRALVATKKSLVRRMRGLVENSTFRKKPSLLFREPRLTVDNPPAVQDVEQF